MTDPLSKTALPAQDADLRRLLAERLIQQARRGVLTAFLVRAVWIAALLLDMATALLPARKLAPQYFQLPASFFLGGALFSLVSLALYVAAARSKRPLLWCYVSMLFDVLCISQLKFFWIWPVPHSEGFPMFVILHYGDVLTCCYLIALYALPLSLRLLWTTGAVCAAMWVGGIAYCFIRYGHGELFWGPMTPGAVLRISEPGTLFPDYLIIQVLLIFCFTAFMALLVQAAHRYLIVQSRAERQAASLLRYFPPRLGRGLRQAGALQPARRRVAVLFVSEIAAAHTAEGFADLAERYRHIEAAVFARDGVIDRFSGGPIMATFGALADEVEVMDRAYACARTVAGPRGAVALHLGDAVCGEIGEAGLAAFSVVGDVVHVARRILDEAERRSLELLMSAEAAEALGANGLASDLRRVGTFVPRGRQHAVAIWTGPGASDG